MVKSGLIVGAVMLVLVLFAGSVISPLCALCVPLLTGLAAGYLTGVFEKNPATVVGRGAGAGGIAGAVAIVGQIGASLINAAVLQNPQNQLNQLFGVPATEPSLVWAMQIGMACVVGIVNVALTAGLAAAGAALWKSTSGAAAPAA